jgi:hypothetical protein
MFPVGLARQIEPDLGVAPDWTVVLVGSAAAVLVVLLLALPAAWRSARSLSVEPALPSAGISGGLRRLGLRPSAVAGVGLALDNASTGSANRATVVGAAASVAALVGALVFAASLGHLLDTPALYGAGWDLTANFGGGGADFDLAKIASTVGRESGVRAVSVGAQGQLTIGRRPSPVVALEGTAVGPTVAAGRLPVSDDEIALGAETARRAGVSVGDAVLVSAGGRTRRLRVVGRVVFPRFSAYPGADKTGLGIGALLTVHGLRAIVPTTYANLLLVDVRAGASSAAVTKRINAVINRLTPSDEEVDAIPITVPARPDELRGYEGVDATPLALAGFLVAIAGATTAHSLVSSVRRRRRELALLKTLGFERRQVRAAVAWQASAIAVVALAIGVPLGIAGGRWAWDALAGYVGALSRPRVPVPTVLLLVPAALALANAVAFVPGRRAARLQPAVVLRSE